jgi:hypothetical protein
MQVEDVKPIQVEDVKVQVKPNTTNKAKTDEERKRELMGLWGKVNISNEEMKIYTEKAI